MRGGLPQWASRRLDPEQRYGLRLTLFGLAIVFVAVPFSTLLFNVLGDGPLARIDGRLADGLNDGIHRQRGLLEAVKALTWLGRPVVIGVITAAAAIVVWRRGRRRLATYLAVAVMGGSLVNTVVKLLVDRPRPVVDHPIITAFGKSFPSGHAMSAVVTYGALFLVFLPALRGRARIAAAVVTVTLIVAIGSSRLILGVHFLSDVIGGYVLGLAWLAAATGAFEIWRAEEGRPPVEALEEGVEPEAGPALRGEGRSATA